MSRINCLRMHAIHAFILCYVLCVIARLPLRECRAAEVVEPRRLTHDGDFKQHLQWSPDGRKFLFTRIHEGKMGLWTMSADGGDLKALLPGQKAPHFDGHWSHDSKRIVFVFDTLQGTDGKLQINTVNADGSDN